MDKKLTALICACLPFLAPCSHAQDTLAVAPAKADTAAVAKTGAPMTLSLDDCIAIALSDNPTVRVAEMDIDRVDYSRWETVSQLLPQVQFTGTYNRMIAKQVTYMNMNFDDMLGGLGDLLGGGGGGNSEGADNAEATPASRAASSSEKKKDDGIKIGLDNSYQVGFSASIPLIAPQLWASLKLSDSQILESVEKARSSKIELVNSVKSAYYALLLATDSRKVIQQSYDMASFTHDLYVKQQALGAASDFDVLRTEVAMRNIEPSLMQADVAIKQAKLQLKILLGLDASTDFTVSGTLSEYEKTMYADVLDINPDYSANSTLVLNDIQTRQLDQLLKIEKAAYYPTLAATASYNFTSSTNGSPLTFRWNPFSVAGLTLNMPIFTGGKRYARIKEAKIQIEEMKYNRQNLERSIAMQVDLAIDNIKVNVGQIESCSKSVAQAEKAHDIMDKSFKIGAASYLNLRDSELALTQSQLAYYQAIFNYLVARAELERLLGTAAPIETHTRLRN